MEEIESQRVTERRIERVKNVVRAGRLMRKVKLIRFSSIFLFLDVNKMLNLPPSTNVKFRNFWMWIVDLVK